MDPISTLTAALSTAAGKALAVAVVGAASVTGLQASGLVEVPGFADTPKDVVVADDTPEGAEHAKTPAEAEQDEADETVTEAQETEAQETEGTESEAGEEGAAHADDHAAFGQSTAADARDGGVDGQAIAEAAKAKSNPSGDRPEAPADVRQDEAARAEHAPAGDDDEAVEVEDEGDEVEDESDDVEDEGDEVEDDTDDDGTPVAEAEEHRSEAGVTGR